MFSCERVAAYVRNQPRPVALPWVGASTPMATILDENGFDAGFADVAALNKDSVVVLLTD